jgi:hypothetical protein
MRHAASRSCARRAHPKKKLKEEISMSSARIKWLALVAMLASPTAFAAYTSTGFTSALEIYMDNGLTFFTFPGLTLSGNCLYNRLELRDAGDYFGSAENARRMYALIISARMADKPIRLGYNDSDGPGCRVAEVWIQW